MKEHPLYKATWPERCEKYPKYMALKHPQHSRLLAESLVIREELQHRLKDGLAAMVPRSENTVYFGTTNDHVPPSRFALENIHCFQRLPVVKREQRIAADVVLNGLTHLPGERRAAIREQVVAEVANEMYHLMMWRQSGRRVYVLDQITFDLLALTELPALPASILAFPAQSFYLRFPPNALRFSVYREDGSMNVDTQPCEGVIVSASSGEPDLPYERDISFLAVGDTPDQNDLNVAYITMTLGPDALLRDVQMTQSALGILEEDVETIGISGKILKEQFEEQTVALGSLSVEMTALEKTIREDPDQSLARAQEYERRWKELAEKIAAAKADLDCATKEHQTVVSRTLRHSVVNADELGVKIPRVILGFLLYLQSEHPDVEPIPPAPRRSFAEVRSPKQREAALTNQAKRLKGATALPILYVGRKLAEDLRRETVALEKDPNRKWQLDHAVWVRGHWRQQVAGVGRKERRLTWIRPYRKGPDTAEALRLVAAKKIQQARLKPLSEATA